MSHDKLKERVEYCLKTMSHSYEYWALKEVWESYETLKMQTEKDERLPAYERILPTYRQRVMPEISEMLEDEIKKDMAISIGLFMLKNGLLKHKKLTLPDNDGIEHVVWFDGLIKKKEHAE